MCFLQRHIKRMLAFSTISHVGLALCGIGLLDPRALSGVVVFLGAYGLIQARDVHALRDAPAPVPHRR